MNAKANNGEIIKKSDGTPVKPYDIKVEKEKILRRYEHSGCEAGLAWQGYTCFDQAPWRDDVDNTLSYGFVASSRQFAGCNRCFELDFGSSAGHFSPGDRGSRELAARGKRMIVQATNIGAKMRSQTKAVKRLGRITQRQSVILASSWAQRWKHVG